MKKILTLLLLTATWAVHAQNHNKLIVELIPERHELKISQEIKVYNSSDQVWSEVELLDWANSFSSKSSPLGIRFAEDFKSRFQYASPEDRGYTFIKSAQQQKVDVPFYRELDQPDILKIALNQELKPGEFTTLELEYTVRVPNDNFTSYGVHSDGSYDLRYWYLAPAVFDTQWASYSNKNLNDYYPALSSYSISFHVPETFDVLTSIEPELVISQDGKKSYLFKGSLQPEIPIVINKKSSRTFLNYEVNELNVVTDIKDDQVPEELKALFTDRIASFLNGRLGPYPDNNILITELYYKENIIYGLSSLPSFLNPFPSGFTYELKMLKSLIRKWMERSINTNPREDYWVKEGLLIYLMMEYHDQYYPDLKIAGEFSKLWGIKSFYGAQLDFNDQYPLLYLNTSRIGLDQSVNTSSDSLVKYNYNIAIPYKSAIGLKYLDDYLGGTTLKQSVKDLYTSYRDDPTTQVDLLHILASKTTEDISWFTEDYITSPKRIDWKLRRVKKRNDSIQIRIKNKSKRHLPVPVYTLKNDSIVDKIWLPPTDQDTTITVSRKNANRVALNYERIIPEFSQRDNYKTLKRFPAFNRPIQFRLFKDVEDPEKSQVFIMPSFSFNIYDGISLGPKLYNTTVLSKPFKYKIVPEYGFNSKSLVGSASLSYTHYLDELDNNLYAVRYGLSGNQFSYQDDLFYRKASGYLILAFRPEDLRSNKRQSLRFRNVLVDRDRDLSNPVDAPDYNVFSVDFGQSDSNFKRKFNYNLGTEISSKFSKISFKSQWRKLFPDNRQLDFRVFAGTFLYNDTRSRGDYFSYALDRPTDYLFDYNYYGRSEDDGFFSQQLIVAEGGFKAQLDTPYANEWITTFNGSYSIWRYIMVYGDVGFLKNRRTKAKGVFDTGIRLNLLQDYFEVYFPIYSSNGWEVGQSDYDERIRFIISLDINTFTRLFSRRWY